MAPRRKKEASPFDGPQPCIECGTPTERGIIDFAAKPGQDVLIRQCEECSAKYEKARYEGREKRNGHEYAEYLKQKRDAKV